MKRAWGAGILLVSPWVLTFGFFWAFPMIYSVVMGFSDRQLLTRDYSWVGWDNYESLLGDADFLTALKNTFTFVVGTIPVTTTLSLLMALIVNKRFPGRSLFRAGYFLPSITSLVVVGLIFTNLYGRGGYLALLAETIGVQSPENGFLYDNRTALYSIMAMDIWASVGYYMLIFLAGLKNIPSELYEVAEIAGASELRKLWSITLPLLRPVALYVVVINSIKSFQVFVEIFVMTKGKFGTSSAVYFIYETGLTTQFRIGYASAAAYLLFIIIGAFSLGQFILFRQRKNLSW